ncbi:hypothetical protein GCM10010287_64310 [Streptomyces variabilis]|uniref:ABC transporter ATP-binding protein n=1 Tax=Streptomyces variabilis TaxID=67372 RepID=A0ABQ2U8G3_9ACTN|nr:hypothetical protein GCM10010265_63890 [Streptomyces griseoincarnatus]GGT81034.1 hypothetical protein GCM10010287_64310 [Streptomyces variabilis]
MYDAVAEELRTHGHHGDEQAAVTEALSRTGLRPPERFFLRHPHELSCGQRQRQRQRQRVMIAGTLVLEPELPFGDAPVASLDGSVRGETLALRLRDGLGLSTLVVTHRLGPAWNIADQVAVT